METRFEISTKMLSIKADDKFLYLGLLKDKCMMKIAFADIKKSVEYMHNRIQDIRRIG